MRKHHDAKQASPIARLSGADGEFVEFSLVNYQFPTRVPEDDHDYDANWLFVQFRVCDGKRSWSTVDPAWLTWDVASLIEWLREVASGERPSTTWTALEPLLTLECLAAAPAPQLAASLALELRSDDVKAANAWDQVINLTPSPDELLNAAATLAVALQRLPPR
jgi:hypothetical protein